MEVIVEVISIMINMMVKMGNYIGMILEDGIDFSNAEAHTLLNIPKFIVIKDEKQDRLPIRLGSGNIHMRYNLQSQNGDYSFLLEVSQSPKFNVKIDLHFQEDETKIGILRIDYNGRHTNPQVATANVPDFAKPFVGKKFSPDEHHVHFHVQGYSTLAWAVPLTAHSFPVKDVHDFTSFINAVNAFGVHINLTTQLEFQERLFL